MAETKKQLEKTTAERMQTARETAETAAKRRRETCRRTAQTTAEQLAERDGAALLQEKYRQERETLENLLERLGAGPAKSWKRKQGAYQRRNLEERRSAGNIIRRWNRYFWMRRREFWRKN
ncbi:MAG: hypothetical protein ACLRIL_05525 [Fusicatenibacter saccharivorans]